jgi:hypothetical protein
MERAALRIPVLAACLALVCAGTALAQEPPEAAGLPDPGKPLSAELAGTLASAIERSKRALTEVGSESKQLECWLAKLATPDADDRVIRWSSVCTEGPGCALGVGADVLAKLGSPEQVDSVNASLTGRKLILHLKSDLVRGYLIEPQINNLGPTFEATADHLEAIAADVARADRELASPASPAHTALRGWIDARKKDAKSVYACAMDVARDEDSERPGGDE